MKYAIMIVMTKIKKRSTKEFRKSHPDYDAEWREKNREKIRKQRRNFYWRHIDKERERGRKKYFKAYKEDPERVRGYWRKYALSPKGKFNDYKKGAEKRKIKFEMSLEEFSELINRTCRYCGLKGGGVDRINNKKGYVKGNIGSCCKWCNIMKNSYGEKEFIAQCKRIVGYSEYL